MKEVTTACKQKRREYIPATVKVTEVNAHRLLCTSPNQTEAYERETW